MDGASYPKIRRLQYLFLRSSCYDVIIRWLLVRHATPGHSRHLWMDANFRLWPRHSLLPCPSFKGLSNSTGPFWSHDSAWHVARSWTTLESWRRYGASHMPKRQENLICSKQWFPILNLENNHRHNKTFSLFILELHLGLAWVAASIQGIHSSHHGKIKSIQCFHPFQCFSLDATLFWECFALGSRKASVFSQARDDFEWERGPEGDLDPVCSWSSAEPNAYT